MEQGKSVRTLPTQKGGAAETKWDHNLHFLFPWATMGEEMEKIEHEVDPRKKGGVGWKFYIICFYFSLPYFDLIGNRLN